MMDRGRHSRLLIVCFLVVVGSPLLFLLQQESSSDLLSGGQVPKNKNQNTSGNTSSNRGSKIVPLLAVVDHDRNHDDGINNKNTSSNPTDREVEGAVKVGRSSSDIKNSISSATNTSFSGLDGGQPSTKKSSNIDSNASVRNRDWSSKNSSSSFSVPLSGQISERTSVSSSEEISSNASKNATDSISADIAGGLIAAKEIIDNAVINSHTSNFNKTNARSSENWSNKTGSESSSSGETTSGQIANNSSRSRSPSGAVPFLTLVDEQDREQHDSNWNTTIRCARVLIGIFPTTSGTDDESRSAVVNRRKRNWRILLRMPSSDPKTSLSCGLNFVFARENQSTIAWFNESLRLYNASSFHYMARMEDDTSIHQFRLAEEFMYAHENRTDYIGQPVPVNSTSDVFHMSAGFFALSTRLVKGVLLAVAAEESDTISADDQRASPSDEARHIGWFVQQAGLGSECCQHREDDSMKRELPESSRSPQCLGRCHLLVAAPTLQHSTTHDVDMINRTRTAGNVSLNPQVSFRSNDGDVASTRLLMPMADNVWAAWFGPPMSGQRLEVYNSLRSNIGMPLKLITTDNVCAFNISSSPMHPLIGKRGLSAIHVGDYLRVYMMHHHGGGYHDVKAHGKGQGWRPHFEEMKANHSIWLYGIKERTKMGTIACHDTNVLHCHNNSRMILPPLDSVNISQSPECCGVVKDHWNQLVSNGAYIMRPGTLLTAQWLSSIEAHLDAKTQDVLRKPAPRARCCTKDAQGYPIRWAELHGEGFHPTQFVYREHIKQGLTPFLRVKYSGKDEGMNISNLFASSCLSV